MNKLTDIKAFKRRVGREPEDLLFVRPVDDDLGMPESPIDSNYSKYLWTSHKRRSGTKRRDSFREKTDKR